MDNASLFIKDNVDWILLVLVIVFTLGLKETFVLFVKLSNWIWWKIVIRRKI